MSLPSPVTSGAAAGIHFKELFNFEVNFSESKYVGREDRKDDFLIKICLEKLLLNCLE